MKTKHQELSGKGLDNYSNFIGDISDIKNWFILLSQTRDSKILEQNKFNETLEILGGESETVQVHRFCHWACGWFEQILIDPNDKTALEIAESIESALADYPVLNEASYYEQLNNELNEYWDDMQLSEKIYYCEQCNISIFQSRSESIPNKIYEYLENDF